MTRGKSLILVFLSLFLLPAPPAMAAVTTIQLQTLITGDPGLPFRQRVQFGLTLIAEQIAGEGTAVRRPRDLQCARPKC